MSCESDYVNAYEGLYPSEISPENRFGNVSSLCSYGQRPHVMTGVLVQLLRQLYVDGEHIENHILRDKLQERGPWRADAQTGILIESYTQWDPTKAEKRPSIAVKRNRWRWDRVLIGDSDGAEWRSGSQNFMGFWHGSHTLFNIAGTAAEAELLGTETARFLLHYASLIVEQLNLHMFVLVDTGGLHELEEVSRHYAVPVTVAYAAEEHWSLEPYAPRLKRIVFRASELLC